MLLKCNEGKAAKLVWTQEMTNAFKRAKEALAGAAMLVHPDKVAELLVDVDASDHHVGAVLQQLICGWGW